MYTGTLVSVTPNGNKAGLENGCTHFHLHKSWHGCCRSVVCKSYSTVFVHKVCYPLQTVPFVWQQGSKYECFPFPPTCWKERNCFFFLKHKSWCIFMVFTYSNSSLFCSSEMALCVRLYYFGWPCGGNKNPAIKQLDLAVPWPPTYLEGPWPLTTSVWEESTFLSGEKNDINNFKEWKL